jgi:hypothetical protein
MIPRLTKTPRPVVCPTDPAVDQESSDFIEYRSSGDATHLVYHADQEPIRFWLRPLDSIEYEEITDRAIPYDDDQKHSPGKGGRVIRRLMVQRACVRVTGWSDDGEPLETPDGAPDEVIRAIPFDFLQWMGGVVRGWSSSSHSDPLLDAFRGAIDAQVALRELVTALQGIKLDSPMCAEALDHARRLLKLPAQEPHTKEVDVGKR